MAPVAAATAAGPVTGAGTLTVIGGGRDGAGDGVGSGWWGRLPALAVVGGAGDGAGGGRRGRRSALAAVGGGGDGGGDVGGATLEWQKGWRRRGP